MTIKALPALPIIGWAVQHFPNLGLSPVVGSAGFGLALLLSLVAGLVPATIAYRGKVADLLRTL